MRDEWMCVGGVFDILVSVAPGVSNTYSSYMMVWRFDT